jgi:hypothetical protein
MTKQEMAEWLAEEVLGWEYTLSRKTPRPNVKLWENPAHMGVIFDQRFIDFIYSPEGLFAVIGSESIIPYKDVLAFYWDDFLYVQDYEAFYKAVHAALKGGE